MRTRITRAEDHIHYISVELGKLFKQKRKSKKLSIKALTELAGVNLATVVDLENGRRLPRLDIIISIGEALGMSPASLYPQVVSGLGVSYHVPTVETLADTIQKAGLGVTDTKEVVEFINFKRYMTLSRK